MAGWGENDSVVEENAGFGANDRLAPQKAGPIRRIADMTLVPLAQGVVGVPEAAVGIADIVTGGRVGKALEDVGFRPREAKQIIGDALYSDEQKEANRKVAEAEGFVDTLKAAVENPSTIVRTVAESLPSIGAGGVIGRIAGRVAPALSGAARGAIGEGAIAAGASAEQVRQESPDGLLTPEAAGYTALGGLATGVISRISGGLAQRAGIADPDTAAATGTLRTAAKEGAKPKGTARRIADGVLTEGVFEELPQSMSEQVFQNLAQGKPWNEGVGSAAAMGLLAGGVTGGAFGAMSRPGETPPATDKPLLLGYDQNADALIGFPDGTVARRSEIDRYIAGLPEDQRPAFLAKLQGLAPQQADTLTTSPGAGPGAAAAAVTPPQAPDLTTSPGAAPQFEGMPFERVVDTSGLTLFDPEAEARRRAEGIDFEPVARNPADEWTTSPGAAAPRVEGVDFQRPVDTNIELGPIARAARMLALPAPGQNPPGTGLAGDGGGNVGTAAQMDMRGREKDAANGKPDPRAGGDFKDAARAAQPPAPPINPNGGPISRAASIAQGVQLQQQPGVPQSGTSVSPQAGGAAGNAVGVPNSGSSVPRGTIDYTPQPGDIVVDEHFQAAHSGATSPLNDRPEPTQRQKDAENYPVGRTRVGGLLVSIENAQGTERKGVDQGGNPWSIEMKDHYGRLLGTIGADSTPRKRQHLDVFIKPGTPKDWKGDVFIIDTLDLSTGRFDEHKLVFGARDEADARATFARNYNDGEARIGAVSRVGFEDMKKWAYDGKQKSAPFDPRVPPRAPQSADGNEASTGVRRLAPSEGAVQQPEGQALEGLRRPGDQDGAGVGVQLQEVPAGDGAKANIPALTGPVSERGRQLRAGELPVGDGAGTGREPQVLPQGGAERPGDDDSGGGSRSRPASDDAAKAGAGAEAVDREGRPVGSGSISPGLEAPDAQRGDAQRAGVGEEGRGARSNPSGAAAQGGAAGPRTGATASGADKGEPKAASLTLRLGTTPGDAEPVTVRDGVVHIGKYPAANFDTGEDVRVPAGATTEQIKEALRAAGAVARRAKFFGGKDETQKRAQEGTVRSDMPAQAPGDRWTTDRGAMPGEPFAFLDGGPDDAIAAMREVVHEGRDTSHYEVHDTGGNLLAAGDTEAEAARLAEQRLAEQNAAAQNTDTPRAAPSAQAPSAEDAGGKADNPRPGGNPAEAAPNSAAAAPPQGAGSQQASAASTGGSEEAAGDKPGSGQPKPPTGAQAAESALERRSEDEVMPSGLTLRQVREKIAENRGMPVAQAQAIVTNLTKGWKGGIEIKVVPTYRELPSSSVSQHTKGYYKNGIGYVVAGRHKSAQDIGRTIAHEVLQHHGLRNILGEADWRRLMSQIQAAADAGNTELQAVRDYVRKAYRRPDGSYMLEEGGAIEADEMAARLIEQSVDANGEMKPKLQWLKWVWAKIASFLRDTVGLKVPFTTAELHGIWVESRRAIETGRGASPDLQLALAARAEQEARGSDDAAALKAAVLSNGFRYDQKRLTRVEGPGMLAATLGKQKWPVFITRGNFGREQYRAAIEEARAAGLSTDKMLVFADLAPYLPKGVTFTKLSEVPGLPESTPGDDDGLAAIDIPVAGYTPEQEAALKNVGGIPQKQTMADRFAALRANLGLKVVQGLFDQFAPLKSLGQREYMLARMSKGAEGTMEAALMYGKPFLRDGVADVDIKDGGFAKVMASLKGEHDRFLWWVAAQRAERLKAEGRENLFTDSDISALKTLDEGTFSDGAARGPVYADALKELNAFNDAALKLAMESGLIDNDAYEAMRYDPYVPFYRVMEETGELPKFKGGSGLTGQQAFKKLKGGTDKLNNDLLHNLLLNWNHLFTASAKNRAAVAAMETATQLAVAYPVPAGTKGAVKVMQDGKAVHYQVEDPYLLEAITALHYVPSPLLKPLNVAKNILTLGVTANPAFKLRNMMRDSIAAIAQSDLSYNPLKNLADGWQATSRASQTYASMLAGGGLMRFGTNEDSSRVRREIDKLGGEVLDEKGWNRLTNQMAELWEAYQEFGDRGENVNRAALYEKLRAQGKSHAEASFMARDLMDFSMGGRWGAVRFLAQTVPFLNARLIGLHRLARGAQDNPRRFMAVTGAVMLASVALLMAYGDDDDWKRREDWDRDASWWFKIGDTAFRIPKPFEIGAMGTLAERTAELMMSEEMTGKRFAKRLSAMLFQTFSFDPTPQMFKPLLDVYANKDSFTGRPIEGISDERQRPQDRVGPGTSEVARFLGQLGLPDPAQLAKGEYSPLSPKQVDFLLRGYFGWFGTVAQTVSDYAVAPFSERGERPALRMKDVFLLGNFAEGLPSGSSRYVTTLYEQAREIELTYNSYRAALRAGDTERAEEIALTEADKLRAYRAVERIKRAEGYLTGAMRRIQEDKTMSAAEKRQRLDELEARREMVARQLTRAH